MRDLATGRGEFLVMGGKDARTNGMNSPCGFNPHSVGNESHDRLQSVDTSPFRHPQPACVAHSPYAAIGV
jgi:hypothetical protein